MAPPTRHTKSKVVLGWLHGDPNWFQNIVGNYILETEVTKYKGTKWKVVYYMPMHTVVKELSTNSQMHVALMHVLKQRVEPC